MDLEFDMQYKSLMVHHLEKHEIEYELAIRAVQFESTESRSVIHRRLRDRLREEKEANAVDVDFLRLDSSVDEEIKVIDTNVEQIKGYLENKKSFEGIKDSLKTRLVHYFARARRAQEFAESDEDLVDLDKLISAIRALTNSYFSIFSAAMRGEVMKQLTQTVSQLKLDANQKKPKPKEKTKKSNKKPRELTPEKDTETGSEVEEEEVAGSSRSSGRRELKSVVQSAHPELGSLAGLYPYAFPPFPYGWPLQNFPPNSNNPEEIIRRFSLKGNRKSNPRSNPIPQLETSDSVTDPESVDSTSSSDRPVAKSKKKSIVA